MKSTVQPAATSADLFVGPALLGIVVATLLVYRGGLTGPFVFDDVVSIAQNPTIRHWAGALSPPSGGLTVSGRPLLNLSFALNYAISGPRVWSYHALNLAIHLLAATTLFGVVRRTLVACSWAAGPVALPPVAFAFVVALLWAVHPLQTAAVTYVVQRAESLMGLFYLLTLYAFVRSCGGGKDRRCAMWAALSVLACLLGMGTKEVMVTAPLIVWFYDRTFVSGSFRTAWKTRRLYYSALACTWLLAGWLLASGPGRGGTAGFGSTAPWWAYGLTQFSALSRYLRLAVWPRPLVFDYGPILVRDPLAVAGDAAVVVGLAALTIWLCLRRRPLGFLGGWFFLILIPSSSVVPVATETMAEHRMYLPLAGIVAAIVAGIWTLAGRLGARFGVAARGLAIVGVAAGLAVGAILGATTVQRNRLYQSGRALWADSVRQWPVNARAHNNLGMELQEAGDFPGAESQFREALALAPDFARAHSNLADLLARRGRWGEAAENDREALRFLAWDPAVHGALGRALLHLGHIAEAEVQFAEEFRLDPNSAIGHFDLGNALAREGRLAAARVQFREALRLDPAYAAVWYNLGVLLVREGRLGEAADAYASAVRLRPDLVDALVNFGNVLAQLDRTPEAIRELEAALRLQPAAVDVHDALGGLLARTGRWTEARAHFEAALRLAPGDPVAGAGLTQVDAAQRAVGPN